MPELSRVGEHFYCLFGFSSIDNSKDCFCQAFGDHLSVRGNTEDTAPSRDELYLGLVRCLTLSSKALGTTLTVGTVQFVCSEYLGSSQSGGQGEKKYRIRKIGCHAQVAYTVQKHTLTLSHIMT